MSIAGTALDLRNLRFNVLVEGQGPDVLLVHGFPDSNSVWRHQIPALVNAGYRVIAPDLRGFGQSDAPPERDAYKIDEFVEDLMAILDALEVRTVRLVGHDWGAAVGWQTCIKHADRIDRYAALAVGHPSAYAHGGVVQKLKAYYVLFFQIPGAVREAGLGQRLVAVAADAPLRRGDAHVEGRPVTARPPDRRDQHLPGEPRPHPAQGQAEGRGADDGCLG